MKHLINGLLSFSLLFATHALSQKSYSSSSKSSSSKSSSPSRSSSSGSKSYSTSSSSKSTATKSATTFSRSSGPDAKASQAQAEAESKRKYDAYKAKQNPAPAAPRYSAGDSNYRGKSQVRDLPRSNDYRAPAAPTVINHYSTPTIPLVIPIPVGSSQSERVVYRDNDNGSYDSIGEVKEKKKSNAGAIIVWSLVAIVACGSLYYFFIHKR